MFYDQISMVLAIKLSPFVQNHHQEGFQPLKTRKDTETGLRPVSKLVHYIPLIQIQLWIFGSGIKTPEKPELPSSSRSFSVYSVYSVVFYFDMYLKGKKHKEGAQGAILIT